MLSPASRFTARKVNLGISPIFQLGKPRLREVRYCAQGLQPGSYQILHLSLNLSDFQEPTCLPPLLEYPSFCPIFPLAWTTRWGDLPGHVPPPLPPPQACPGQSVSSDMIWDSNEQNELAFK